MNPEAYFLNALTKSLRGDVESATLMFRKGQQAKELQGFDFSESVSDEFPFLESVVGILVNTLDFARCVRPDGTAYGTRGKCRKGTEQEKENSEDRLEREIPRAVRAIPSKVGPLNLPRKAKKETPEQVNARIDRNKKVKAAEAERKRSRENLDRSASKIAEDIFRSRGGASDGSVRSQNRINNIKESLKELHGSSRKGSKASDLIEKGDTKGILKLAEDTVSKGKEEHTKARVKEERDFQKATLKEKVGAAKREGRSEEEIRRLMENERFYQKRDLKRAKAQAEAEFQAMERLLM